LHSEWEVIEVAEVGADDVRTYMTRDLVKATPDAGVGELARMMLDAHVHRVVVVDPEDRPVGIVTSTDILAAVARMVPLS
jgi:CBS domain-containing protein